MFAGNLRIEWKGEERWKLWILFCYSRGLSWENIVFKYGLCTARHIKWVGKNVIKKNKTKQQQGHNKNLTLRDNTGCVKPTAAACAMSIKMWADIGSEKLQGISSASEGKEYEQEMCEKGDNVLVHKKRQKKLAATQKEGGNTVKLGRLMPVSTQVVDYCTLPFWHTSSRWRTI